MVFSMHKLWISQKRRVLRFGFLRKYPCAVAQASVSSQFKVQVFLNVDFVCPQNMGSCRRSCFSDEKTEPRLGTRPVNTEVISLL